MGLITSIVTGQPIGATYSEWNDFWYTDNPRGNGTAAGIHITPESSLRLGTVYACVGLISDMIGSLPLLVYRRLDNEGKERARSNPLYNRLKRQPNVRQTSKEWRTMGGAHLLLRGNFYNEIIYDGRGSIAELRPLHPDRMAVELLASGRRGYVYRPPSGNPRPLTQDEVFHVMGLSLDGVTGVSVIEYARESIAAAQAQDQHAAGFWGKGGESALMFSSPNTMTKPTREANEAVLRERLHKRDAVVVLDGGLKPEPISVSGRDAQWVESRRFSVSDIARFFRVPPHMVGDVDGSTSWGTGIEQQTIGFVNFTLMPWLVAFEQAIDRDLILDEIHFAEFNVDGLLRGESGSRATSHRQYVDGGIKSVNEVRIIENLNPLPGEEFARPHRAGNMGGEPGGGDPETTRKVPVRRPAPPDDEEDETDARTWQIATAAAERLVRREIAAIRKWAPRYAGDTGGWQAWAANFYGEYVGELETALAMDQAAARRYCADRCALICASGGDIAEEYERKQPAVLAALALGGALPPSGRPDPPALTPVSVTFADGAFRVDNHIQPPSVTIDAPVTVQPSPVTIAEGAIRVDVQPAQTTIAPGAVQVSVEAPPPAAVTVHAPVTVERSPVEIAKGAVQVNVTTPPMTIDEGAVQVHSPVTIADGAVRVHNPITVEPAAVTIAEGAVQVSAPVTVKPAQVTIEEGAVQVAAPAVTVEAPPPANVTIAKGAVQIENQIETPEIRMPEPRGETVDKEVLERDAAGRPHKVRETRTPKR